VFQGLAETLADIRALLSLLSLVGIFSFLVSVNAMALLFVALNLRSRKP